MSRGATWIVLPADTERAFLDDLAPRTEMRGVWPLKRAVPVDPEPAAIAPDHGGRATLGDAPRDALEQGLAALTPLGLGLPPGPTEGYGADRFVHRVIGTAGAGFAEHLDVLAWDTAALEQVVGSATSEVQAALTELAAWLRELSEGEVGLLAL